MESENHFKNGARPAKPLEQEKIKEIKIWLHMKKMQELSRCWYSEAKVVILADIIQIVMETVRGNRTLAVKDQV